MIKTIVSKLKATDGFAFPLTLFITVLVVSFIVAGLVPLVSTQARHVTFSENHLIAKYSAEAGVKRGLRQVLDALKTTQSNGKKTQPSNIAPFSNTESLLRTGGINYIYNYQYIAGSNKPSDPERIEVTASSTVNNITYTSTAWMVFDPKNVPGYVSPNLIDYIIGANDDHKKSCYHLGSSWNYDKWLIGSDESGRQYGAPQDGSGKNYILFNDNFTSSEFRFDYNIQFEKAAGTGSGGGGVIYGASEEDTAYSFNAYCVKFNNDRQAFSVTKFYKEPTNKLGVSQNEYFIDNNKAGANAKDKNCITSNQAMFQPNGIDEYKNDLGNCSITFTDLKKILPDFDPSKSKEYTITVKTEWKDVTVHTSKTTSYEDKRLEHIIELNGKEVLRFVDLSDVTPVTKEDTIGAYPKNPKIDLERKLNPDRQIRTGLRVVNVKSCRFYNSNIDENHIVRDFRRIIWKK